jgi:hypothetical protein
MAMKATVLTWTIHQAAEAQEQEPPKPSLPLPGGKSPQMHIHLDRGDTLFWPNNLSVYTHQLAGFFFTHIFLDREDVHIFWPNNLSVYTPTNH